MFFILLTGVPLFPWLQLSSRGRKALKIILINCLELVPISVPVVDFAAGVGRRGFDPRQLRRTKRAFFPPLAI
jgi:hypothetical protein